MLEFHQLTIPIRGGVSVQADHPIGRGAWRWAGRAIGKATLVVGAVMAFGVRGAAGESGRAPVASVDAAVTVDSFAHARHTKLPCMTCHLSNSGAMLTFEAPRGCQICHHTVQAKNGCAQCHQSDSVPQAIEVHFAIAAADKPARERTVVFRHERHAAQQCTACHGQPVTLAPVDSARTCQGCHADHHQAGRNCATCHRTDSITQPHTLPVQAHIACDRCHTTAAIAPLTPTRSFCLVCHEPSVDHHPERECVACHLQASPEEYRPRLLR